MHSDWFCFAEDGEGLRKLIDRVSPRLEVQAYQALSDVEEALDAVQETWVQVFRKREHYQDQGNVDAWIMAIGRSVLWERIRNRKRESAERRARLEHTQRVDREAPSVDDRVIRDAAFSEIVRALPWLRPREQEAIILRYLKELSPDEVADLMGVRKGTMRGYIADGIKKLRQRLA